MKRSIVFLKYIFFACFIITFIFFCLSFLGNKNPFTPLNYKKPLYNNREEFDPSLIRLDNLDKLGDYCDSLFKVTFHKNTLNQNETDYINLVGSVVRKRFYWGYSCYDCNSNYLSLLFSKITQWGYDAIVIPDDILKYPYAACSQQSIVMMELLERKGFFTRKVGFFGINNVGHFAFEAFYNNSWHLRDPTLEPDTAILNKYNRPDIKFLTTHPEILYAAYRKSNTDKNFILDVFSHYKYGKPDIFPAPNAFIFHKTTKFLSNTVYIFFLLAYLITGWAYKKKYMSCILQP
jgi:hypothetical protein